MGRVLDRSPRELLAAVNIITRQELLGVWVRECWD